MSLSESPLIQPLAKGGDWNDLTYAHRSTAGILFTPSSLGGECANLNCARRTSTVSSCGFREHGDKPGAACSLYSPATADLYICPVHVARFIRQEKPHSRDRVFYLADVAGGNALRHPSQLSRRGAAR